MLGFLYATTESDNIESFAAPVLLNLYLTYLTVNFFFNFFESASYTLMMCLAVDIDLTNTGLPEFGPSTFHQMIKTVKATNKKRGGFTEKEKNDDENDQELKGFKVSHLGDNSD